MTRIIKKLPNKVSRAGFFVRLNPKIVKAANRERKLLKPTCTWEELIETMFESFIAEAKTKKGKK